MLQLKMSKLQNDGDSLTEQISQLQQVGIGLCGRFVGELWGSHKIGVNCKTLVLLIHWSSFLVQKIKDGIAEMKLHEKKGATVVC